MGLRTLLRDPAFDPHRTLLCFGERGEPSAFAILWGGQYLGMLVRPDTRGSLEPVLLAWAMDSVRRSSASGAGITRLYVLCLSDDTHSRTLLEQAGYTLDMTEWRMGRVLDKGLPESQLPAGFTLRTLRSEQDMEDWLGLYAASFPANVPHLRRWRHMRADEDWQSDLDLIAVDSLGRLAGACTCTITRIGRDTEAVLEGRTEPVMVRSELQGLGLGSALVRTGLRLLRERRVSLALLTTESDNHGAHRLYSRLGYQHLYDACWYGREA